MVKSPALVCQGITIGLTEAEWEALGKYLAELRNPSLGQVAYEAYGNEVAWKNYQELPMPTWEALPLIIQRGWHEAAIAAVNQHEREKASSGS